MSWDRHRLTEGAFVTQGLVHDAHSTIDGGKVACLNGTYVGEFYGLTEGAFVTQGLTYDAHGTIDVGEVALLDNRRR